MSDYIVLKIEDVNKYLGSNARRKLHLMMETIEKGRLMHGIPKLDCNVIEGTKAVLTPSEKAKLKIASKKIIRKKVSNVKNKS